MSFSFGLITRDSALESADHAVDGLVEVHHLDCFLALAGGVERGLVDEIGEVGADEARACGPPPWRDRAPGPA